MCMYIRIYIYRIHMHVYYIYIYPYRYNGITWWQPSYGRRPERWEANGWNDRFSTDVWYDVWLTGAKRREYDLLVLNVGNGWEWGNGIIIDSDYGSFPHFLLSTSKMMGWSHKTLFWCSLLKAWLVWALEMAENDDVCPSYFKKWTTSTDVFVSEFHLPNATWKSSNVFRESSWYRFKLVGGKTAGTRGFPWTYPGSGWPSKEETSQLPVPVALVSQKPCNRKPQLRAKWSRRRISISPVFFSFGSFHKWGVPKNRWSIMESPSKIDVLEKPHFKVSQSICAHVWILLARCAAQQGCADSVQW